MISGSILSVNWIFSSFFKKFKHIFVGILMSAGGSKLRWCTHYFDLIHLIQLNLLLSM